MFGKRHMVQLEGGDGIGAQDLKEQLRLGSERTSGRIFRKALVLEIMKQRVETFTQDSDNECQGIVAGSAFPK
jgi:hypothetical protein